MLSVIKKDLLMNYRFVLFTIIYSIVVPILINADGDKKYWMISVLLPIINVGFIVGKATYIEDSEEVQVFLKSLPIKYSVIVLSKYVQAGAILILTHIYAVLIEYYYMHSLYSILLGNLFSLSVYLLYFSVYFYLYYRKNYFYAQNSIYFLLVIGFALYFIFGKSLKITVSIQDISIYWFVILDLVALVVFAISYRLSLRAKRG
ncbi:hypothetical protein D3C81_1072380 [compost metagenome]